MAHPLTDEMIDEIAQFNSDLASEQVFNRGCDMQAAADWQLDRDTEYFFSYLTEVLGWDPDIAQMRVDTFRKTMRPQEES